MTLDHQNGVWNPSCASSSWRTSRPSYHGSTRLVGTLQWKNCRTRMVIKLESDRDTQNSSTIITRIPFHIYISACSIIFRSCYIIICTSYVYIYTGKYDQTNIKQICTFPIPVAFRISKMLNGSHEQLLHAAHLIVLTILSGNHGTCTFSIQ